MLLLLEETSHPEWVLRRIGQNDKITLYKDPSRKAITSGNLSEVPDKSPFIEFLLKKLNENEDKYLPAQQLFSRIFEPVSNNSSATPQFGVIQGAGDQGGDFIFIRKD